MLATSLSTLLKCCVQVETVKFNVPIKHDSEGIDGYYLVMLITGFQAFGSRMENIVIPSLVRFHTVCSYSILVICRLKWDTSKKCCGLTICN